MTTLLPLATRRSRYLLDWSAAACLAAPEQALDAGTGQVATFTRASVKQVLDQNGVVRTVAHSLPAFQWSLDPVSGLMLPGVLLEDSRTNSVLWSRDLSNAAWTFAGTGTRVFNAAGVNGTANSATTLTDTDAAAATVASQSVAVTNNSATHCATHYVKRTVGATSFPMLSAGLSGGTAVSRQYILNTDTGVLTSASVVGAGSARVFALGPNWWGVEFTVTNNTTGNTSLTVAAYCAASTNGTTFTVTATGSCIVGQVQVELNATFGSSIIFTTSASVTRAADSLSWGFNANPFAISVYEKHVDLGSQLGGAASIYQIGTWASNGSLTTYHGSATALASAHYSNTTQANSGSLTSGIVFGDTVETRTPLSATGVVQAGVARNGGSETLDLASVSNSLSPAWAGQIATLNIRAGGVPGFASFQSFKIAFGAPTLAQLRQG